MGNRYAHLVAAGFIATCGTIGALAGMAWTVLRARR
jgi:hypothetical protein